MSVQSRIIGHGEAAPDQLLANPLNFRRHPGHQLDALRDHLHVRTVKDGCSPQGQCGCCTVLVDGDICNIDITAYINGVHGDTNATFLAGDVDEKCAVVVGQGSLPASRRGAYAATSAELKPLLLAALRPGDTVLVKGSNGAKMSVIVDALKEKTA